MKSSRIWLVASVLALFSALVHTFAGTPEIQRPLLDSAIPHSVALLLYACWHLVTVALFLSAAALLWSSRPHNSNAAGMLPRFIGLLWLMFGLVFVVVALVFDGPSALFVLPQWVLLVPVGVLCLLGDRRRAKP